VATGDVEKALSAAPADAGPAALLLPEDQWFERKSSRISARDLANTLIGFANADGGIVVIGLHSGVVEGTKANVRRRNEQTQAAIDYCAPLVRVRRRFVNCRNADGEADQLLAFEVQSDEFVHANKRDEVYLRVGDENRKLTFAQRQELTYDKGQSSYESRPLPGSVLDQLDMGLVHRYAKELNAEDALRLLRARGLSTDGEQLTIAGCLLFATHPQQHFPEGFIRVIRYRGKERGSGSRQQIVSDQRLEGPIPTQIRSARDQVRSVQPVRRALLSAGTFGDVPLVPEDAWLEGIVNAAVHRSYSVAGDHIRVEVFDDRIEVSSPGRFPGLVDLSDPLDAVRFARNPHIARVCADLNFGQELGEGIRRMFEEMRGAGLSDPVYRQTSGSVELTLLAEPVDRELDARLPENARRVLAAMRQADRLSTGEVQELLDVSRPTAQRELGELKDAGIIEWIGKSRQDPRAYWCLAQT
jgi:ATP-dependent DNA helicase RecG